jgi:hypothetical protein
VSGFCVSGFWMAPFFNEANPTKVNTTTSDDDDVYFKSNSDANKSENSSDNSEDEMPDNSDDGYNGYDEYNGYDGYNEYSECDRGYYYRNRRYERKISPMMNPIISLVTA